MDCLIFLLQRGLCFFGVASVSDDLCSALTLLPVGHAWKISNVGVQGHPYEMPEAPQLASFSAEEQRHTIK